MIFIIRIVAAATIDFSLAQVRLLIEGGPAFIGPIFHGTVDSNRNSNGRTALQIIEIRPKNSLPNSRRTRPSSSYAAFQHDRAWLEILTTPI